MPRMVMQELDSLDNIEIYDALQQHNGAAIDTSGEVAAVGLPAAHGFGLKAAFKNGVDSDSGDGDEESAAEGPAEKVGADGEDTDDGMWLLEDTTATNPAAEGSPASAAPTTAFSQRLAAPAHGVRTAFKRLAGSCAAVECCEKAVVGAAEAAEGNPEQNYGVKWIKRYLTGQPVRIRERRGRSLWAGCSGRLDGMEEGKCRVVFQDQDYELYYWSQLTLTKTDTSRRNYIVAYEDGDKQVRTHAQMLEDEFSAARLEVVENHPRTRFSAITAAQAVGPKNCRVWCKHGARDLVLDRRECEALLKDQFDLSQVSKSMSDIWTKNERGVYGKVTLTAEGGNCIFAALQSLGYNFPCDQADDLKAVAQRACNDKMCPFDIRKMKECGPHCMEFLLSDRVERPCDMLGVTDNGGHCVAVRVPSVGAGFIMDSRSRGVVVPLTAAGMARLGITNVQLVRKVVCKRQRHALSKRKRNRRTSVRRKRKRLS